MKNKSILKRHLENLAGEEEIELVVPYAFLPPRFRKAAKGRNMKLLVRDDLHILVHWQDAAIQEFISLNPRGARKLLREALANMTKYASDLQVFGDFMVAHCKPALSVLAEDRFRAPPKEMCAEVVEEKPPTPAQVGTGGESPLPPEHWDF